VIRSAIVSRIFFNRFLLDGSSYWLLAMGSVIMFVASFLLKRNEPGKSAKVRFIRMLCQMVPFADDLCLPSGRNSHSGFTSQQAAIPPKVLVHENRDLTRLPLSERRQILSTVIKPNEHAALSVESDGPAANLQRSMALKS
jgi:hypothetical protein